MSTSARPEAQRGLILPPDWEPERDILVWIGAAGPNLPRGARVFRMPLDGSNPDSGSNSAGEAQVVRTENELFQALLSLPGASPRHAKVHRCAGVPAELHRRIAEIVGKALRTRATQKKTLESSGLTWLRQGLANLATLAQHPSIEPLAGALKGVPCVLVSPGPSLSRNIEALRELSSRALIISGTHALSALANAGVTPHLVVCADPGDLRRHWEGVDLAGVEAFVVAATCGAETLAVPARRRFTFAGNGRLDAWLFEPMGENPWLSTGGSVACSMLSLALHLGCDPIVMVGQDLSFTDRFYAEGGLDGDAKVAPAGSDEFVLVKPRGAQGIGERMEDGRLRFTIPQRALEVPGWGGGTVRTTPQLKVFLDWFEHVAPELAGSTKLLNCTEGGARIAGLEHVALRSASAAWKPLGEPIAAVLERASSGFDPVARREGLRAWAQRTLRALEECVRHARACQGLAALRDEKALARREKKLSQALKNAPLVSLVAQGEIQGARDGAKAARTVAENLVASRRLYGVVEKAGEQLTEPLRKAWRELG